MAQDAAPRLEPPSLRSMVISLWPSILLNGVLVLIIYQLVRPFTSEVLALFISAIPAMIGTIVGLIRQRQVDVLGVFALITIAVSIVLVFFTGNAKLLLIRESFLTLLFGIICVVSLLFKKPIWFYIIRYFATGNKPDQIAVYNAAWQAPQFRTYIRHVTVIWGVTYIIEFILRLVLVYKLSTSQFLVISPIIFYGITIAVIAFTLRYGRYMRERADEMRRRPEEMEIQSQ